MNLREFIARLESKDFNNPEKGYKYTDHFLSLCTGLSSETHDGDCINQPSPCFLCQLAYYIREFKEFTQNPERWKKENGI